MCFVGEQNLYITLRDAILLIISITYNIIAPAKVEIITWDWIGDHAAVSDPLVAIFSSRKTDRWIADYLENLYLSISCTAEEMAYYANRRKRIPYKATTPVMINGIPHGGRMICGYNPWLHARIVSDLKIESDDERDCEVIRWREPPVFQWKDENRLNIEVQTEGRNKQMVRRQTVLLSLKDIG